jgi:hypothetical protein
MNRPMDYKEGVRTKGFAPVDDDFDFMPGDLCCEVEEETSCERTRESLAKNRTGCLDPMAWMYASK